MALRKRKAADGDAGSRFSPKRAKNALAVAKIDNVTFTVAEEE